jgi:hypothetical protein
MWSFSALLDDDAFNAKPHRLIQVGQARKRGIPCSTMTALNREKQLYSLIVSGERFELTKAQIESDPGNYFVTLFFGDFAEADNGCTELVISKEPKLFKLIQAHLRGYIILPLPPSSIPDYMTLETTLINLLTEAQYYGLQLLVEKIEQFQLDQQRIKNSLEVAVRTSPKTYKYAVSVQKGVQARLGSKSVRNMTCMVDLSTLTLQRAASIRSYSESAHQVFQSLAHQTDK